MILCHVMFCCQTLPFSSNFIIEYFVFVSYSLFSYLAKDLYILLCVTMLLHCCRWQKNIKRKSDKSRQSKKKSIVNNDTWLLHHRICWCAFEYDGIIVNGCWLWWPKKQHRRLLEVAVEWKQYINNRLINNRHYKMKMDL